MSISLVIPVKQLENAKQRLGGLLSLDQRQNLFQAMVEDVLEAATTCDLVDEVIVVTSDETVSNLAGKYSARVIPEPENPGLIAAVTYAAAQLRKEGVEVMAFLPGDVPLVTVEELEVVLDGFGQTGEDAEFMIVPASDLGGSNCVVCSPPDCMEFGFGEDSFRRHLRIAKDRNIQTVVAKLPGIGLDVDTPEDLFELVAELKKQNLHTNTSVFLENSGMLDELAIEVEKRLMV
ncbi:MAG: 2-phospho-L-lactate guanylyltransferase [bacterium]|nr:2-phospho-L-lactate guanylyltransferase [Gammaproteobacteria bacterium]HIL98217.1 2-phospho-L-lactate guanylyltransferase [Pseudomonadales bacterium]